MMNGSQIGGALGVFLFVVFWGMIIFGLFLFVKSLNSLTSKKKNNEEALQLLKMRYAKGDIDRKEYEEMRKEILSTLRN